MSVYRRFYRSGGTYFFTVVLADRTGNLLTSHVDALRAAFASTKATLPFKIDAIVVLPEHLHALLTLPADDSDFSNRWRCIKARFSRALPRMAVARSGSRVRKHERTVWQRRFWEHVIRDEDDYARHVEYIHYNPVKHGHVPRAADWPYSSFHRYVREGVYPIHWASVDEGGMDYGE